MGDCGCGDLPGMIKLQSHIPGYYYIIDIYPGCGDCDLPIGAVVKLASREEVESFHDHLPLTVFDPDDEKPNHLFIPVLSQEELVEEAKEHDREEPITEYGSTENFLHDAFYSEIRGAVFRTLRKWDEARKSQAASSSSPIGEREGVTPSQAPRDEKP